MPNRISYPSYLTHAVKGPAQDTANPAIKVHASLANIDLLLSEIDRLWTTPAFAKTDPRTAGLLLCQLAIIHQRCAADIRLAHQKMF